MKAVISLGYPRVRDAPAQVVSQETDLYILQGLTPKYMHLRKLKRLNIISDLKRWHQPGLCDSCSDLTSRRLRRLVWKVLYWHGRGELTWPLVVSNGDTDLLNQKFPEGLEKTECCHQMFSGRDGKWTLFRAVCWVEGLPEAQGCFAKRLWSIIYQASLGQMAGVLCACAVTLLLE